MEQNYVRFDLRRNSKCRWSDNELYQSRQGTNPQYKHVYAYDGKGRIACFTARVPSNRVQRAPSDHQESGYTQLKEVLKFYKPPEISSYAVHPPKSSSKVKYDDYPKMYAKHKVDHDIQYKESCIDENHGLSEKGKRIKSTNTPYSFLFCSEYLKQRLDKKDTVADIEQEICNKNKVLLVKPETRDIGCGNYSIHRKSSTGKRLKRINTSKRIKRLVIYKRVYRTMKELENLFKVSKSKWEMAMAKESEESIKAGSTLDGNEQIAQISRSSSNNMSEVKVVMTTSHTAITPFDIDIPKVSESSPAISTSMTPLKTDNEEPEYETKLPLHIKNSLTTTNNSQANLVEMKDASTECYFKRKRRRSIEGNTPISFMRDLSSMILKELRYAISEIPKMSYVILVTFYSLP